MAGFRAIDVANEQMLANYLDEHFYNTAMFQKATRVLDKDEQLLGKDIIVTSSDLGLNDAIIDEKNTGHYVNKNIPTFAFELSFLVYGSYVEGWLTDPNKQTEYYLLIWPFADLVDDKAKVPEYARVTKANYLLVKRADILDFLAEKGLDRNALQAKARQMRASIHSKDDADKMKAEDRALYGFWFMSTPWLVEKPVNVVIPRVFLEKMAIASGSI